MTAVFELTPEQARASAAVAAAIQAEFPRDRARQNVFFEIVRAPRDEEAEDDTDADDPVTPPAAS